MTSEVNRDGVVEGPTHGLTANIAAYRDARFCLAVSGQLNRSRTVAADTHLQFRDPRIVSGGSPVRCDCSIRISKWHSPCTRSVTRDSSCREQRDRLTRTSSHSAHEVPAFGAGSLFSDLNARRAIIRRYGNARLRSCPTALASPAAIAFRRSPSPRPSERAVSMDSCDRHQ